MADYDDDYADGPDDYVNDDYNDPVDNYDYQDEMGYAGTGVYQDYNYGAKMIFNEGERVKVVGNSSGHQMPIGTILTIKGYNGMFAQVYENHMSYYEVDLEAMPYRLEDAQKAYNKAEKRYLKEKTRLDYMQETGVEELSEKAFREHMVQKILQDGNMSLEDKTKNIEAVYSNERTK
jgi:hypothetical protein